MMTVESEREEKMSKSNLTGRKVYRDYGPAVLRDVGHIVSDSPDDDGRVKISWDGISCKNILADYLVRDYIESVLMSTIHDEGWTSTNGSPIGIFYDSD